MLLSVYTYVKEALYYDLHVVDMLKHHLPLADEIVVNEGYSSDGTYERISGLDPKIKIQRNRWNHKTGAAEWYIDAKDTARRLCRSQWCLHLDADEFVPEWEFEAMRQYLASAQEEMVPLRFLNFYGNYQVVHAHPQKIGWPARKMILHRNRPDIEFWGDGANIRLKGKPFEWGAAAPRFTIHHFGAVLKPARLRQKWHLQARAARVRGNGARKKRWLTLPSFAFNLFPHDWRDPDFIDDLELYPGPYVKAVRENPDEFVRDRFQMARYLQTKAQQRAAEKPIQQPV